MVKDILVFLGVVFVIVGILGFFMNPVLGLFAVDTTHNIIHLVSGILAIGFGLASENAARNYAKTLGVIYALVAVAGLFSSGGMVLGIFASNGADTVLHFILAATFLYLGFAPMEMGYPKMSAQH